MTTKHIKSVMPIYCSAALWLIMGLILKGNILKIWGLLITALLSVGAYFVASKIFKGEDIEVEEAVSTGDAAVDRQIEESRAKLKKLKQYDDVLPDPEISKQLGRMKNAGDAILEIVEKNPAKAADVQRFLSYFLPTAEKLVSSYVTFDQAKSKTPNIVSAMRTVESSLERIADAFEKQLDSLMQEKTFDIETDVSVLQTLLAGEGLLDTLDLRANQPAAPELKLQTQTAGEDK